MSRTKYNIHNCKESKCDSKLKQWLIHKWMQLQELKYGKNYWLE